VARLNAVFAAPRLVIRGRLSLSLVGCLRNGKARSPRICATSHRRPDPAPANVRGRESRISGMLRAERESSIQPARAVEKEASSHSISAGHPA